MKSKFYNNKPIIQSNPFYKLNKEVLESHYPLIARQLSKIDTNKDYETTPTKEGLANLHLKLNNSYFYENDKIKEILDEIYNKYNPNSCQIAVFLGFDVGNKVVHYMLNHSQRLGSKNIVIIEKDLSLFKLALRTMDLTQIIKHKQVKLIVGESTENLYAIFERYLFKENRYLFLRATKPFFIESELKLNSNYYRQVWSEFKRAACYAVMNYGNDAKDSLIGVENMLDNLDIIINNPGINLLKNKFSGKPAVVVSGGPSLNKNKHLLKGLEDKAVIICADSTLRELISIGVKPHLVTALEREHDIEMCFKDLTAEQLDGVYLAACPVLYNHVYKAYKGKTVIIYREFKHFEWLDIDKGMLSIKSSAGNMAFKVAEYMGCNPIILIGQDLALSRDGQTNMEGSTKGAVQNSYLREARFIVPGNDGQPIETTASLKLFLDSYTLDVHHYKGRCINATEGGAYINKTQVVTFQDAIDKELQKPFNPIDTIKSMLDNFIPDESHFTKVNGIIQETKLMFDNIIFWCDKGLKIFDDLKDEIEALGESLDGKRLSEIMGKIMECKLHCLNDNSKNFQLFYSHVAQSFYLNHEIEIFKLFDLYDKPEKVNYEMMIRQKDWFEIVGGLGKVCLQVLNKVDIK